MILKFKGSMRWSSRFRDHSGQALVEGALTLLLLFVFLFGIFEVGRLLQVQQALTDAAREGARRGIVPLTRTDTLATDPDVQGVVSGFLAAASLDRFSGVESYVAPDTSETSGAR